MFKIPTGKDIFIEVNGKRVAVVQSYKCKTSRERIPIKSFGERADTASIFTNENYTIELEKVIPILSGDNQVVDFYSLSDFSLVIVKPNYQIIYSACEWTSIDENCKLNSPCIENITIVSSKRLVVK